MKLPSGAEREKVMRIPGEYERGKLERLTRWSREGGEVRRRR